MGIKFLDIEGEKMKTEKEQKDLVGIYIRTNSQDSEEIQKDIFEQVEKINIYCEKYKIRNKRFYFDVRKSGLSNDRIGLKQMKDDIEKGMFSKVIVTRFSIISRDAKELLYFGNECVNRNTELISLDIELNKDEFLNDKLTNEIKDIEY